MAKNDSNSRTLRLIMPEWQGGDYDLSVRTGELYPLGAEFLKFAAPKSETETIEVPIQEFSGSIARTKENGVVNQEVVIEQMRKARDMLDERKPDKVVTFGGECLVSQAPFDYLNGRYQGKLGIVWLDAHPDVSTPDFADREHAMVLGNLLGGGDPLMAREVRNPFSPEQVIIVGPDAYNSSEEPKMISSLGLTVVPPGAVAADSEAILRWIKDNKIDNVAIHLDLDVLDPKVFYSQFPNDPAAGSKFPTALGKMDFAQVTRIIDDISRNSNLVGLTIAEPMPWDAMNLRKMMGKIDILK